MRIPLIAGNWKMNGTSHFARELLTKCINQSQHLERVELAVFPSFPYLTLCKELLASTRIAWGAQNMSDQPDGALTGEVSASMLKDLGCQYVLLGHSERRHTLGESNEFVAQKVKAALLAGLTPILCVGETLDEYNSGRTWEVVQEQLAEVFRLKDNSPASNTMVIAYEPVWAIGTGKTASPEQAENMHSAIRNYCEERQSGLGRKTRILYGGSVKPENAQGLFEMPNIDGALVGGASLDPDQFIAIANEHKVNRNSEISEFKR